MQRAFSALNKEPFTEPMPAINPSAGVLLIKSSSERLPLWAAIASAPYSMKLSLSQKSSTLARAVFDSSACVWPLPRGDFHQGRRSCLLIISASFRPHSFSFHFRFLRKKSFFVDLLFLLKVSLYRELPHIHV